MAKLNFQEFIGTPAKDLLVSQDLKTCSPSDSVKSVIQTMAEQNIGCMVIVDGQKPIGIFTERDVLRKIVLKLDGLEKLPISQVMTKNPVCVKLDTPFSKIMAAMRLGKFRHLIVIDPQDNLKAVISIKDVLSRMTDFVNELKEIP